MTTTTFDTPGYFEKLKAAGVPEEQAKIQANALRDIIENSLVTKRDLKELNCGSQSGLAALRLPVQRCSWPFCPLSSNNAPTNAMREIIEERLAAKADLVQLEHRLTNEMQKLELRMTLKLGAMLAASIAVVATLVKLL